MISCPDICFNMMRQSQQPLKIFHRAPNDMKKKKKRKKEKVTGKDKL